MRGNACLAIVAVLGLAWVLCGCGLASYDFVKVCDNGLDAEDNAEDHNDYAWAMEYFVPDGATDGYLYVGTGNNMLNLIIFQFQAALDGSDIVEEAPVRPPEIRRYRPDLGEKVWERSFDYRDVEQAPNFDTIGFRNLKVYRSLSDGVNYLYAASMGEEPTLWRSATGEPGSWEQVWADTDAGSVRWMEPHNGLLYFAMAVDIPGMAKVGRVWATDGATFWPVIQDGFGNPDNTDVDCLTSFNGWLYAGTTNVVTGYEVWKFAGPDDAAPVRIVANGGPSPRNELVGTPHVFRDQLYMGSLIFVGGLNVQTMNGFKGCDIIRIDKDDTWETVVGPDSISGYDSGFDQFSNAYLWWMEEHDGWLYASTLDQGTIMREIAENWPAIWDYITGLFASKREFPNLDRMIRAGADLYKTHDGVTWYPVSLDGMGNTNNYGIRTMKSVGTALYLGTANPFDGLEIWRGETAGQ